LTYSDSIEKLFPNHSILISQKEFKDLPVKAVQVSLQIDQNEFKSTENHINIFLNQQNVVYDLHFKSELVSAETIIEMARTVIVK
jgi:hypothetical protein